MKLHRILRIKKEKEIYYNNNQRLRYLVVLIVDILTKHIHQTVVSILHI
jgi:hypothetical protein